MNSWGWFVTGLLLLACLVVMVFMFGMLDRVLMG